jgi:hypothetical protein
LVDPWEPIVMDFADQYSYASEEIDKHFPTPLGDELEVHMLFDSDHAHDKITGRSISGVIVCVCNTPIILEVQKTRSSSNIHIWSRIMFNAGSC